MKNKILYWWYSRIYKNKVDKSYIELCKNANYVYLGRQNGKRYNLLKMNYIRAVENYDFKFAKRILSFAKRWIKKLQF